MPPPPCLLLISTLNLTAAFKVLVDLNLFSRDELAQVHRLPAGLDGAWEISVNSPNTSDAEWRAALHVVAPNGYVVTEDNPMQTVECSRYRRLFGRAPSLAFNYHETGGQPFTQLNNSEIEQIHQECGTQVVILTRAFWPHSRWRTGVTAVLNNTHVGGVAMEFNPGEYGKRNEMDFVVDVLAARKRPFFLFSPVTDGRTQEDDVAQALSYYRAAGVPLHSDDVYVVIARYGSATPQPCPTSNPSCVYGDRNSVAAALRAALAFRDKTDTPSPAYRGR